MLDGVARDFRAGLRQLRAGGVATWAAVLALTLGIGATAAVFSLLWVVALAPLPFPEPDRLVRVEPLSGGRVTLATPGDFGAWRDETSSLAAVAGLWQRPVTLTGDGPAERVSGAAVTGAWFEVLGVSAARG